MFYSGLMRVTGGELRGQRIRVPRGGHVRPTQDFVREALFSILGARIPGARVLDLFAGSGAVGIDAYSRGASFVCWVEDDRRVLAVLQENVQRLCPAAGRVYRGDAAMFLRRLPVEDPYDVIFCDPPYRRTREREGAAADGAGLAAIVRVAQRRGWLASRGVFVCEQGADERVEECAGWLMASERRYGRTVLRFYQPADGSPGATEMPIDV